MKPLRRVSLLLALASAATCAVAQAPAIDPEFPPMPPVLAKSAADEAKTFQLPPGYRLELVLSEPHVVEPMAMAFDADGKLYIAEMRTYMQDIEGTGEHEPTSRVSVHWSSKNDGVYDQHRVFADNLLLPRLLMPMDDGVLIGETDTNDIHLYRDTNGDGVADEHHRVYEGGPRGGNMEHQPSGLLWGMDNWLYMASNSYRLRWKNGALTKQDIPGNGGQWGASMDDQGKLWVVNAGGERGPVNFQQHILYGQFQTKEQFEPDFAIVWPAMGLRDFQGGPGKSREDGTLNHFTATCGGEVYRGDKLLELRGNLLFGEPVGRLVRRSTIEVKDGLTILHNPYPQNEFLRSTDASFRPVDMKTAPDGTLFICDAYRGIIQEGNWTREGSYLRKVILQHGMEKVTGHGRIWRLVHDAEKPATVPALSKMSTAQLIDTLAHPNGFLRDTAQRLLVLRQDKEHAVPALAAVLKGATSPLARSHALWTLEGLEALTPEHIRSALKDKEPAVRHAALRASETLMLAGDTSLIPDVKALAKDSDASVAIQALLTARQMKWKDASQFINISALGQSSKGVKFMAAQMLNNRTEFHKSFTGDEKKLLAKGQVIFEELCYTCHGYDGKGMTIDGPVPALTLAASLSGSKTVLGHRDGLIRALLHGVTGPIGGKTFQGQMIPMAGNDDEWIASVLSYVRNSFGNSAGCIDKKDVARVRADTKARTAAWTEAELLTSGPAVLPGSKDWKLTASNGAEKLASLCDGSVKTKWDSAQIINDKMWITVELPAPAELRSVTIHADASTGQQRNVSLQTSEDGQKWSKDLYKGPASCSITDITFTPVKARFLRLSSATREDAKNNNKPWSINELTLHGTSAQ